MQVPKFINTELKSDSESDLDSDLEKVEAKIDSELKFISDNDSVYDIVHWFSNFLSRWLQIKVIVTNDWLLLRIDFYWFLFYDDWFLLILLMIIDFIDD